MHFAFTIFCVVANTRGAEKEETVKKCVEMLENTMGDTTVPRNIRRSMGEIKKR
ncbi:MAG: UPF0147 family protein [Euryarchaeota archaeon]|nr:UPF0147 family protein [Euryarchaeota archaeon]